MLLMTAVLGGSRATSCALGRIMGVVFIFLLFAFSYCLHSLGAERCRTNSGRTRDDGASKSVGASGRLTTAVGLDGSHRRRAPSRDGIAVTVARELGLSEFIIGVTLVAVGTSLPELATAFIAAIRKDEADLVVGAIIGSNVFNILGAIGVSAAVAAHSRSIRGYSASSFRLFSFSRWRWRSSSTRARSSTAGKGVVLVAGLCRASSRSSSC